ncbi:MAG: hypothetical protein R2845_15700 [Thermomicrobiales bacterium]
MPMIAQVARFGKDQKPVEHAQMRFRLAPGEQEQRLIGIGEDDLFDIPGVTGQSAERSHAWLNRDDLPFPFPDIDRPNAIAHGHKVGSPAMALDAAANGGHQDPVFVT